MDADFISKVGSAPTIMVIFGVTGDLSRRKLIPALVDLEAAGMLPERLKVIGFSRRDFSGAAFPDFVREALEKTGHTHPKDVLERFCARLDYCPALFDDKEGYRRLGEKIFEIEKKFFGQCANKLYYLATPPDFYETIFRELADSGLTIPCGGDLGWARILVEKPFGKDIDTAQKLDELLGKLFKEEQIFRIDHYLAKEAVQNLLTFRFSNALFEPLWNREHIESVSVVQYEKVGVAGRGSFYDGIGALRDVGQNHLLQMLALIAMEHPKVFDAPHIRAERGSVLKRLKSAEDALGAPAVRAQYKGYRDEEGVDPQSKTETYFKLTAEVHTARFKGVPFTLESGKALSETKTEIVVRFKPSPTCLACGETQCVHHNTLTFRIQPGEGISVAFWIKKPGFARELQKQELSFSYAESPEVERLPDAYERLLFDAFSGDQTLFASTEETREEWQFTSPIIDAWQDAPLREYEKGSNGPGI